jgi:hypothetical protein
MGEVKSHEVQERLRPQGFEERWRGCQTLLELSGQAARARMVDRGVYKPKRRLRAKDMARSRRGWR